jgi:hypothetical protein
MADIEKRRKTYEVITKTLVTKHYRVEAENEKEAVDAAIEPTDTFVDDEDVVAVDEIKE